MGQTGHQLRAEMDEYYRAKRRLRLVKENTEYEEDLYDGHLKELFMREGASLGGQVLPAGTDIMDLQEFSLSYASDDLIRISLRTASGEDHTFYIHVHCNTTTE